MARFAAGQMVSATTQDHGHLAIARVKSFTGIVTDAGQSTVASGPHAGQTYEWVWVKLAPSYKVSRRFDTHSDRIEVIG